MRSPETKTTINQEAIEADGSTAQSRMMPGVNVIPVEAKTEVVHINPMYREFRSQLIFDELATPKIDRQEI